MNDVELRQEEPLASLMTACWSVWPLERWVDVPILVGVSGGADSIGLLRTLVALRRHCEKVPRGEIVVAHYNHGLRGDASDADESFVKQTCDDLGLQCV
ncbi:MAG: ATP-binding protein, partial [Planctomycetota bacterium]